MNGKISLDQTGLFEEIKKNQHDIASVSQTFQDILKNITDEKEAAKLGETLRYKPLVDLLHQILSDGVLSYRKETLGGIFNGVKLLMKISIPELKYLVFSLIPSVILAFLKAKFSPSEENSIELGGLELVILSLGKMESESAKMSANENLEGLAFNFTEFYGKYGNSMKVESEYLKPVPEVYTKLSSTENPLEMYEKMIENYTYYISAYNQHSHDMFLLVATAFSGKKMTFPDVVKDLVKIKNIQKGEFVVTAPVSSNLLIGLVQGLKALATYQSKYESDVKGIMQMINQRALNEGDYEVFSYIDSVETTVIQDVFV